MQKKKTVFVGLSGGVDSSVAALRLKRAGHEVVGVFIKVWHPDFLDCNWEAERLDAMRVAAKLDIPFLTCDAKKEYEHDVAQYFIEEYKAGRTPNPDVMCNKQVKFKAFLNFAKAHNADYIATGHYARRSQENDQLRLWRGVDKSKDQSYFLWTLTQDQLQHVLLPVGDSPKTTIRAEAEKFGLITAGKKDSQGICFLGQVDIPDFLNHYIDLIPGTVLDETGKSIGKHKGAVVYTIGQRHGFSIDTTETSQKPHYVIDRNIEHNTITVSATKPTINASNKIKLEKCNFIGYTPQVRDVVEAQSRYRQTPVSCTIESIRNDECVIKLNSEAESVGIGQSCVLYKGEQCIGGGIIAACL